MGFYMCFLGGLCFFCCFFLICFVLSFPYEDISTPIHICKIKTCEECIFLRWQLTWMRPTPTQVESLHRCSVITQGGVRSGQVQLIQRHRTVEYVLIFYKQ